MDGCKGREGIGDDDDDDDDEEKRKKERSLINRCEQLKRRREREILR